MVGIFGVLRGEVGEGVSFWGVFESLIIARWIDGEMRWAGWGFTEVMRGRWRDSGLSGKI